MQTDPDKKDPKEELDKYHVKVAAEFVLICKEIKKVETIFSVETLHL